ncbi:hypothetical protein B2K11_04385 [Microbacterium sp. B35-30]|nr:hypothetical protein B2K11_04385 [Microbacterium sp. B35-30]
MILVARIASYRRMGATRLIRRGRPPSSPCGDREGDVAETGDGERHDKGRGESPQEARVLLGAGALEAAPALILARSAPA